MIDTITIVVLIGFFGCGIFFNLGYYIGRTQMKG